MKREHQRGRRSPTAARDEEEEDDGERSFGGQGAGLRVPGGTVAVRGARGRLC